MLRSSDLHECLIPDTGRPRHKYKHHEMVFTKTQTVKQRYHMLLINTQVLQAQVTSYCVFTSRSLRQFNFFNPSSDTFVVWIMPQHNESLK